MVSAKFDLRAEGSQPVQRLAALLLSQAVFDRANRVELALDDASSTGTRFMVWVDGIIQESKTLPGSLFLPLVVVFCNYAGINYYARGTIKGTIDTHYPACEWRMESSDLRRVIVLCRVSPIPPIDDYHPIDWGGHPGFADLTLGENVQRPTLNAQHSTRTSNQQPTTNNQPPGP